MVESDKKPHFTIEEKILLHLLDFIKYKNEIVVPQSITQKGISSAIGINRKHIPRSLKSLIDKGYIFEKTLHVQDKPQRLKTYFLTFKGEKNANNLKVFVSEINIKLIDKTGTINNVKIGNVCNIIKDSYSCAEIITYLSPEGIFDVDKINDLKKKQQKKTTKNSILIYKKALAQAWKDGKMTKDEKQMLLNIRKNLNISEKQHLQFEEELFNSMEKSKDTKAIEVYKIALEQALEDGVITKDEQKILDKIKKHLKIEDE
jgi:hypothetical protein